MSDGPFFFSGAMAIFAGLVILNSTLSNGVHELQKIRTLMLENRATDLQARLSEQEDDEECGSTS